MKPYIVYIETSHPQYYKFTELFSLNEEHAKEEATKLALNFITTLNYYEIPENYVSIYRITIFFRYEQIKSATIYRSCLQQIKGKEFVPKLSQFVYYFNHCFYWISSYLYYNGDTPCHNEPILSK